MPRYSSSGCFTSSAEVGAPSSRADRSSHRFPRLGVQRRSCLAGIDYRTPAIAGLPENIPSEFRRALVVARLFVRVYQYLSLGLRIRLEVQRSLADRIRNATACHRARRRPLRPSRLFHLATALHCPGPFSVLQAHGIVETWAVLLSGDTIRPMTSAIRQTWEAEGIDWRARALENLRELSPPPLATETWIAKTSIPCKIWFGEAIP